MKKLSILAIMLLCCVSVWAQQNQKDTKSYNKPTGYGNITMPGKVTRSWYLDNEGKKVFNGPLSVNCTLVNTNVSVWPYDFTLSGTYTSVANFAHDKLNGASTSSYKLNVKKLGRAPETKVEYQTFSGNFLKGVPNGAFKMDCNGELKLTVTYKNGALVGSFYYEEVLAQHKITGTLSADGKPTGQWVYKSDAHITRTMQMLNGVLISERYVDTSNIRPMDTTTEASVAEMAKRYASGAISETELYAKGYIILEEELLLGDKVSVALKDYSGFIGFTNPNAFEFSNPNRVPFKVLSKVNVLNDEGVKRVTELILGLDESADLDMPQKRSSVDNAADGKFEQEGDTGSAEDYSSQYGGEQKEKVCECEKILCRTDGGNGKYYYSRFVRVLDNGVAYVQFNELDDTLLTVRNSDDSFAYMTAEAFSQLKQAVHDARVARAKSYVEYLGCDTNIEAYRSMDYNELSNIRRGWNTITLYPHPEYEEYMITDENVNALLTYVTKSSYDEVQKFLSEFNDLIEEKKSQQQNTYMSSFLY